MRNLNLAYIFLIASISFCVPTFSVADSSENSSKHRIINGIQAENNAWPWMVALVSGPDNYSDQFCGGVLIDSQWVLTAAHCVDEPPFEVLIGINNLNQSSGDRHSVSRVYIHPEYFNSNGLIVPDVALIKLDSSTTRQSIPLATTAPLEGVMATAIGWGATNPNGGDYPYNLLQAEIPIVSQSECNRVYDNILSQYEICAGFARGGTGTCQGDSGGPLMVQNQGKWELVGITSWGRGCAEAEAYDVYVDIASINEWIIWNKKEYNASSLKGTYSDEAKNVEEIPNLNASLDLHIPLIKFNNGNEEIYYQANFAYDQEENGTLFFKLIDFKELNFEHNASRH